MQFELVAPWTEWNIETDIGELALYAKIDTGAFTTLIGLNIALKIGLSVDFIKKQKCVKFIVAVEGSKGYAFKVPCSSIPLGNTTIPSKEVCVPFTFIDNRNYSFVTKDRFLIGTNVLNDYNMNTVFNKDSSGSFVKTVHLKLTPHNCMVLQPQSQEYTLIQLANTITEVKEPLNDYIIETILDS